MYKHSYISSIADLAEVVLLSTTKDINVPQLISEPSSSNTLVPVRKWKAFLETYFKKIPSLTKYHHFRLTSSEPSTVFVREFPSSPETRLNIMKDQTKLQELLSSEPELITPPGLTGICMKTFVSTVMVTTIKTSHVQSLVCPNPVL